jgi:N-carbamoyl-L-amino-acid hydrolase
LKTKRQKSLKPIAFGSHIDMVPDGGNYDGTLGSLAFWKLLRSWMKINTSPPILQRLSFC